MRSTECYRYKREKGNTFGESFSYVGFITFSVLFYVILLLPVAWTQICGVNEVRALNTTCQSPCQRTCQFPNPIPCPFFPFFCVYRLCNCRPGFVRSYNLRCVRPENCPRNQPPRACSRYFCPAGQVCRMVDDYVGCISQCFQHPECVPTGHPSCAARKCPVGKKCRMQAAICFFPPCVMKYLCMALVVFTFFLLATLVFRTGDSAKRQIPSGRMIEVYQSQAKERRDAMSSILSSKITDFLTFYNTIVPEVFCDELVRIGTTNDGGKWMCSPFNLPNNCVIVDLGLNDAISFDVDLQRVSEKRCRIIGFDMGAQSQWTRDTLKSVNAETRMAKIGTEKGTTVADLMEKEGVKEVEILKIDIEGAEFDVLIPFLEKFTVAQVLVEVHAEDIVKAIGSYRMVGLLNKMAKLGYWLSSYEINGRHHNLSEFSLLHQSRFDRYQATPLAQFMLF